LPSVEDKIRRNFSWYRLTFGFALGALFGASYFFAPPLVWSPGCFSEHVSDAMAINYKRKSIYRNYAKKEGFNYRSQFVSSQFILMEKLLYPLALYFDNKAKPYNESGSDLLCREFIDMKQTPTLPDFIKNAEADLIVKPEQKAVHIDSSKLVSKDFFSNYRSLFKKELFKDVATLTHKEVTRLKQFYPHSFCLYRHFIESLGRVSDLIPMRRLEAKNLNLPDPKTILKNLMRLHYFGLTYARLLDQWALPLQKAGIPILCNDFPEIPIPVDSSH